MKEQSCERPCSCKKVSHDTQLVVLTGGPGAGKTAVLEFVRKALCEHIVILPEAASVLFGGGFWRLESDSAKRAAQRAIYHVQDEMQNLVLHEKRWSLGLCDRGTLDGLAYWPGTESAELASKIDLRIHDIWKTHPQYSCIDSKSSFMDKLNEAASRIQSFVPECCREHLNEVRK